VRPLPIEATALVKLVTGFLEIHVEAIDHQLRQQQ